MRLGRRWATGLLEAVFPPRCCACDAVGRAPFCAVCAEATAPVGSLPPRAPLEAVFAAWAYGGPVEEAVVALKGGRVFVGPLLGSALAAFADRFEPDRVVAVPASPARLVERGFSPAREIARGLGRRLPSGVAFRVRDRPRQTGLPRGERLVNPIGAFGADPAEVRGRRVLVVDDVLTTGATVAALAQALIGAGASCVAAAVVAASRPEPAAEPEPPRGGAGDG